MNISKPSFAIDPNTYIGVGHNEKKEAKDRFMDIYIILSKNRDKDGMTELVHLFDSCVNYIKAVVSLETHRSVKKEDLPVTVALDEARKRSHDNLLAQLNAFNRYISKKYGWLANGGQIPPGGICTLPEHQIKYREKVADWAWALIAGLFSL